MLQSLFRLPFHGRRHRVLDLEPMVDAAGPIVRAEALRDDPLAAERAGVLEDDRPIAPKC